jgi:glycosyltransferase involved in cell wall biosynthesis
MPSVSVIIPLYNKEKEVVRAINSVLSQTVKDFEIIVINDGSIDKGPDLVKSLKDSRITVIDQDNEGVSAARNKGIAEAQSELIAFLDADDEWKNNFLEVIFELINQFPECSIFATSYFIVNKDGIKRAALTRGLPAGFQKGVLKEYFRIAANSDPPLWTSAVVVKKSAILSVGGFPVGIITGEDLLTWAQLAARYDIAYSVEPKAFFWKPLALSDRPGRVPDEADLVGKELKKLLTICEADKCDNLRDYIALWYRMRASIYLRFGKRVSAFNELKKALCFSRRNIKLFMYFIGIFLPKNISTYLIKFIGKKNKVIK